MALFCHTIISATASHQWLEPVSSAEEGGGGGKGVTEPGALGYRGP